MARKKQRLLFILGGARSGKSSYALQRARAFKEVFFIATAEALDEEMRQRIQRHQKERPAHWRTIEAATDLAGALASIKRPGACVVIDCLTLWVSNLLLRKKSEPEITKYARELVAALRKTDASAIVVSNEVGLGVVPANTLARRFRDIAGKVNQLTAAHADEVVFMVAGIPLPVKKGTR